VAKEPAATDWAYAAGFVDGEGCISVMRGFSQRRDRYIYGVGVIVVNRDRSVLDWMRQLWSGWVVAMPKATNGQARAAWAWRSPTGLASAPFLTGIRPWLRLKGQQCDNALEMVAVLQKSRYTLGPKRIPLSWLEAQERHYWIQRELNHRGNQPFEAKAMHSPRKIRRQRDLASKPVIICA
jgi:hypothetical protein